MSEDSTYTSNGKDIKLIILYTSTKVNRHPVFCFLFIHGINTDK
jgi:hypothetical protein